MATETRGAPWGETRGIHTTAGGMALQVDAAAVLRTVPIPNGTRELEFSIRNAQSSAKSVLWAVNPSLIVLHTADALATAPTDATNKMRDGIAANVLVLDSLGAGTPAFIYVGAKIPFGGVAVNVTAVNGTSSVLTVKYWNGSAWADISDTDGTIDSGETLAVDGNVTWTIPTSWTKKGLKDIGDTSINTFPYATEELYWTRWEVSVALDSEVEITGMHALSRNTYFSEIFFDDTKKIAVNSSDLTGNTSFEAKTNAGTGNMIINAHAIHNFPTN